MNLFDNNGYNACFKALGSSTPSQCPRPVKPPDDLAGPGVSCDWQVSNLQHRNRLTFFSRMQARNTCIMSIAQ